MAAIKPGALCLIVGARPAFEDSIGAIVRVRERRGCPCGCGVMGWTFGEANRPVTLQIWGFNTPVGFFFITKVDKGTDSRQTDPEMTWHERHLMPIDGDETLKHEETDEECTTH